jgi:hypothetical protein
MKPLICLLLLLFISPAIQAWEISNELSQESRVYLQDGSFGNTDSVALTTTFQPDISHSWDDDRMVISILPYFRSSSPDQERSQVDIREASFVGSWEYVELRAGISQVYWGVTESQHLVDVINQTDFVENSDGESKLGQLMIAPTLVTDYGNLSYFFLPHFRERTFPGSAGRFRTELVVDTNNPIYTNDEKEAHVDHAFRYTNYIEGVEYGLSYFTGTDREPLFVQENESLRPKYVQMQQFGLDAQYVTGAWAFKFEGINKNREDLSSYYALTTGVEYTFGNVYKGMDIGVLAEYLYDDRGTGSQAFFPNHVFSGARLAFNNEQDTNILAGFLYDGTKTRFNSFRMEASSRINNQWKWAVEINSIFNTLSDQPFYSFRNDDYVQLTLSTYF